MFPKIQEIIDVLKKVDNSPKSKLGLRTVPIKSK